jgi:hypothetical protein
MTSRWSNSVLLVAILLLLGVEPFLFGQVIFDAVVSVVLLAAVWVVSQKPHLFFASFVLLAPTFVGRWLLYVVDNHWLAVISAVFAMGFFCLTVIVLLWRAFGGVAVTADTIAGAICAYLLLGVVWAFAFSLVELAHPGAFLVTLSTVGYGDIVPVVSSARMLAVLEAVTGQIYLAVLIGGLVGLHMQSPRSAR